MLGRLTRSTDFERALGMPACARSLHFAIHFVPDNAERRIGSLSEPELSTVDEHVCPQAVDDLRSAGMALGAVLPKRHARRSVTRSLLKRQIRAALATWVWPAGICVVRLRAPFDRTQYGSATSPALRRAARAELDAVVENAQRHVRPGGARKS